MAVRKIKTGDEASIYLPKMQSCCAFCTDFFSFSFFFILFQPRLTVTVQEAPGSVTKALWKLLQETKSSSDRTLNPRQLFGEICKTLVFHCKFLEQNDKSGNVTNKFSEPHVIAP